MSLYSIADLHLSCSTDKPMDIFGSRWQNYTEKLEKRWRSIVSDDDTVIIPGDISWAMTLDEAEADLAFIDSLPGKKYLGKGNHDFWWSTVTKMTKFLSDHEFTTIGFLYNNAIETDNYIIAGSRGWYVEEKLQNTVNDTDYEKIVAREDRRLRMSLDEAKKLSDATGKMILVYFHFPPVFKAFVCEQLVSTLKEYGIENCYYGHIHGVYNIPKTRIYDGIRFTIISADYLDFVPMITMPINY